MFCGSAFAVCLFLLFFFFCCSFSPFHIGNLNVKCLLCISHNLIVTLKNLDNLGITKGGGGGGGPPARI